MLIKDAALMNETVAEQTARTTKPATEARTTSRPYVASRRKGLAELDGLLWRIQARTEFARGIGHLVGLTSCGRKSGVSTTVANLAVRAAEERLGPVLVIDANVISPQLHKFLRMRTTSGLMNVLAGETSPSDAVRTTNVEQLGFLSLGTLQKNRTAIARENYIALRDWVRQHYAIVFVDLPPLDEMRQQLLLAQQLDTTIVAVRSDAIARRDAEQMIATAQSDGLQLAGTILTRKRSYTPAWIARRFR